jgi:AraC family transcriptional regulator
MECLTEAGAVFESDHRGRSTMRHHRHTSPYVAIVLNGSYVEVRDAVPEVCHRGAIVVHDAIEEHADSFAHDTRCLNVELPYRNAALRSCGKISLDNAPLRGAVDDVVRSFYLDRHELLAAVKRLQAALLDRGRERPDSRPPWLHEVIDNFSWTQPIPIQKAAAIAGVHETHFSRAFHRHVGMTPNEYRSRARIRLASELLLTTTTSLASVALSCGFSDQSHLTRAFSARLGLAPALYRRTFVR